MNSIIDSLFVTSVAMLGHTERAVDTLDRCEHLLGISASCNLIMIVLIVFILNARR